MGHPLILASASPRRREIIGRLGLPFLVDASSVDETPYEGEPAGDLAVRLALAKAREVAARHDAGLVIGADTVVVRNGHLFGKPRDADEALEMLQALRGGPHTVITGVAVVRIQDGATRTAAVPATVYMRPYTDQDAMAYVATGEPMDKAGAYGAQGHGRDLIDRVDGPFLTVVGLPLDELLPLLRELGLREVRAVP
jgi:septum formation protein